jgi:hypothetical protein
LNAGARLASLLLLACSLAAGWYVWRTGPVVNVRFGHDVPVVLDGAWRVLNGQVPNVDFHSLFGPLFFLLAALGMALGGPSLHALVALNLVLFFALAAWAWAIAWPRAHVLTATFFTALVGLVILGTYHLGFDHVVVTYANLYNRYGYALLFILMFERMFPPREAEGRQETFGAASTGVLLVALLFLKVTFFVVGLGFVVVCGLLRGRVAGWRAVLVGALVALAPMALYLRFGFGAVLRDYLIPLHVRRDVVASQAFVSQKVLPSLVELEALGAMVAVLLVAPVRLAPKLRAIALVGAGVLAGAALNVTNYGESDMPLLALVALVPVEHYLRALEGVPGRPWVRGVFAVSLVALAAYADGRFVYKNVASIRHARALKLSEAPALERIAEPPLSDLLVVRADGVSNERYAAKLNEGFALLRANTTDRDRITCLNFENPFSFGLQRAPPVGDVSSWHFGYGFDDRRHWPAEQIFRGVTVLMIPREPDFEAVTPLLAIYGGYLAEHYEVVASSPRWQLARRR